MRAVKRRWLVVGIALLAAIAFAMSVQGGRWWTVGGMEGVEIGPYGSKQCFGGECRPAGLSWTGGTMRWARTGIGTWAAGLLSMLMLLVVAGAVAANRVPRLAARTTLVAIVTAAVTGGLFIAQVPDVPGASFDRGVVLFAIAIVLGVAAALGVLRYGAGPRTAA